MAKCPNCKNTAAKKMSHVNRNKKFTCRNSSSGSSGIDASVFFDAAQLTSWDYSSGFSSSSYDSGGYSSSGSSDSGGSSSSYDSGSSC